MESGVTQPGTFTHSSSVSMIVCHPNASAHQAACFRTSLQSITTVYHRSTMKVSSLSGRTPSHGTPTRTASGPWAGDLSQGPLGG